MIDRLGSKLSIIARLDSLSRTESLLDYGKTYEEKLNQTITTTEEDFSESEMSWLEGLIIHSGRNYKSRIILISSLLLGSAFSLFAASLINPFIVPFFTLFGASIPFLRLEQLASARADEFSADYPVVLLATASSLKTGLTAQVALARSAKLLPNSSLVRKEMDKLIASLHRGTPQEIAVDNFAKDIRLPEVELFRSAFLLVLRDGGKLSQTLQRLALVSRDRTALRSSAATSTATMRMTANILLLITPFILFIVSFRSKEFWNLIWTNPTANFLASLGIIMIAGGYIILSLMSRFKP